MALGLFACRHAAAAEAAPADAADAGVWTPVLRLGGSRSLASVARAGGRASTSSISRTSLQRAGLRREEAAGISSRGSSGCYNLSISESEEGSPLDEAPDKASEDETTPSRFHIASKRVRRASPARQSDFGWHDTSSSSGRCNTRRRRRRRNSSSSNNNRQSTSRGSSSRGVWGSLDEDVIRCRFSPNGCYLAVCTSRGALRVYEVETGQQICNIPYAHVAGINDICWHHSSSYIFTASSDGSAALFPLKFRTVGGAARRLLRDSTKLADASSLKVAQLHVETAVAPVLDFHLRSAAAAASAAVVASSAAAASSGTGRGSQAAGHSGSVMVAGGAAAATRHSSRHFSGSGSYNVAAAAPVTSVTAPQRSAPSSSVHCVYTGSYDELIRSWDMRASWGPLLQVRAHDGPVTSLDFIEASPLLLPPYIPSRSFSASCACNDDATTTCLTFHGDCCCSCSCCSSTCVPSCRAPHSSNCCCGVCCSGCRRNVSSKGRRDRGRGGAACCLGGAAAAVALALDEDSKNGKTRFCAATAAAAISLPDMLASASVDGLVRLWQAPGLKLLRTTRGGRGGWEGGSSGATSSPASAAAAAVTLSSSSSRSNGVGCGSPAAAAVATAGCCHVTWSRSGNFLLCLYEQGLGGGTVLRLRTPLQQPQLQKPQRRQEKQAGEGAGLGEERLSQQFEEASERPEEDSEEEVARKEETWWGRETCMPLPSPYMWDEVVQQELLESACKACWHRTPCSSSSSRRLLYCNHRPAAEQGKTAAGANDNKGRSSSRSSCREGDASETASAATSQSEGKTCDAWNQSDIHQAGSDSATHAVSGDASRSGTDEVAFAARVFATAAESSMGTRQSALHALFCRKERGFSPYGAFWRDCAVLPGSDGCVRIFNALRGKLLHTLVPAADVSGSSSAVCTSVDAHPDWSVGVLASSCSAPDGAVVIWLWERDES